MSAAISAFVFSDGRAIAVVEGVGEPTALLGACTGGEAGSGVGGSVEAVGV